MNRIAFCTATVKRFEEELQNAYQRGEKRVIRRISVLVATNRQNDLTGIAATWGIVRQTINNWIAAFLEKGWDSLVYGFGICRQEAQVSVVAPKGSLKRLSQRLVRRKIRTAPGFKPRGQGFRAWQASVQP